MRFASMTQGLSPRRLRLVGVVVASLALLAGSAGTAAASATDACPQGFETITLAQAASEGYVTSPTQTDEAGNGDGIVCRRALGQGIDHLFPGIDPGTQIYYWVDNATPRG